MIDDYKTGGVDKDGEEITYVYGKNNNIVVFECACGDIRWEFNKIERDINLKVSAKYHYLRGKIPSTLPETLRRSVVSELANAMFNALNVKDSNDVDGAFEHIQKRITLILSPNQAKLWLILYSLFSSFTLVILLSVLSSQFELDRFIALCAGAGVLGSMLSFMQRNSQITVNLEEGRSYIFLQAAFIPILGMLSGVCLFVLSNSDLAFSFAKDNIFNLLVLSIFSGFSERYVPDLFKNVSVKTK